MGDKTRDNRRDKLPVMILVLGTVAALFGGALAFVNAHAQEVIEARVFKDEVLPTLNEAFGAFHPNNDFLKDKKTQFIGNDAMGRRISADIYVAQTKHQPVAMATIVDGRGYGGLITVLVAADVSKHEIISVKTLAQKETRGIGDRIASHQDPFVRQFIGMRIESDMKLSSNGGEIDAMSGATVTSVAFSKTVKAAAHLLLNEMTHKGGK